MKKSEEIRGNQPTFDHILLDGVHYLVLVQYLTIKVCVVTVVAVMLLSYRSYIQMLHVWREEGEG